MVAAILVLPFAPTVGSNYARSCRQARRGRARQNSRRTFRQTAPPPRQAQPGVRKRLLHLRHSRQSRTLSRSPPPPHSHPGAPGLYNGSRLRHAAGDRRGGFQERIRPLHETRGGSCTSGFIADLPSEAQYVVPFAYKIRWYMKMNLREAVHMCELRTMPQGHPDYRFICQEMWRKIQKSIRRWPNQENSWIGRNIVWAGCSRRCGRSLRSRRCSRRE